MDSVSPQITVHEAPFLFLFLFFLVKNLFIHFN